MPPLPKRTTRLVAIALFFAAAPSGHALDIVLDYRFDTANFFLGHPERQGVLEAATQAFELRLADVLTGINPGGNNTWTQVFQHPGTGATQTLKDRVIAPGELRVFAGARQLGAALGIGGPGGANVSGSRNFIDTVLARGQSGALAQEPTDFGPWGGTITFDLDAPWYFDPDVTTTEVFPLQHDFYSVAVHELAHLLGFGTADSWETHVAAPFFTGPASVSQNAGLPVPLHDDLAHWAEGTQGRLLGALVTQEASMDPTLTQGTRKYLTELDYAGLADVGWLVIPEPSAALLLALSGSLVLTRRRVAGRRRS